ncbi:hypothetical protein QWZ06_09345 [Chryseobacterium tructae]|uniref:C1q domain-containing protein n=1 Tax=Chryseobacterium tructae TaxID=1037380 RepID=A0ABV7XVB0_9FLAO|nr:hypothetical protein [Chryseobacterium tructae]MDN3692463.1 hypothetical protein [Chryseobacterium tructae]
MKEKIIRLTILICLKVSGQIGINTSTPSAMVDVVSKSNTSTTKAMILKNSDNLELLKVLDNGNVGINTGTSSPSTILDVNTDVKHENLPVLTSPYQTLALDANGGIKIIPTKTQYFYFKRSGSKFGSFSLYDPNIYSNIPFSAGSNVLGNTIGISFGNDSSGSINGQSVNNIDYLIIPEPGVYVFEMYQTATCNGSPSTLANIGQIMVNTIFGTAASGTSVYSVNNTFRNYLTARRNIHGKVSVEPYTHANPQMLSVVYQSTKPNEKVALFINYAGGDAFNTKSCFMRMPINSDNFGYLIMTKL